MAAPNPQTANATTPAPTVGEPVQYISNAGAIFTLKKTSDGIKFDTSEVIYASQTAGEKNGNFRRVERKQVPETKKDASGKDIEGTKIVEETFLHPITDLPPLPPDAVSPPIREAQTSDSNVLSMFGGVEKQSMKYKIGESSTDSSKGRTVHAGLALGSKANDWSLFKYFNRPGVTADNMNSFYKEYSQAAVNADILDPTARSIVEFANGLPSKSFKYKLHDFAQCEHYGQISNDYMITLRRFAFPVPDDIVNTVEFKTGNPHPFDTTQPDIARAITWMSPGLGNDIKEILKFNVKYNWKEQEAQLQEIQASSTTENNRGALGAFMEGNSILSAFDNQYSGYGAVAAAKAGQQANGYDSFKNTYPNHVFGPLNVIKKVLIRDQGLEFDQEFSLKFYYNIKAYPNTSPRIAFLDTIANLLALTYSTAPFWGGATRYVGGGGGGNKIGKPFGDFSKLASGDYAGFATSLFGDIQKRVTSGGTDVMRAIGGMVEAAQNQDAAGFVNAIGDSKMLDNLVGGGLMKLFGGPQAAQGGQVAAALLSGDPAGSWHLTIGNPMVPVAVIGDLAMTDAQFEFEGPMSLEGFPSKVVMTVKLKPSRARDKGEIESMFNAGRGRLYLQPEVLNEPDADGNVTTRDINAFYDVSAYGNKDNKGSKDLYKRVSNFAAG
jgi:hypothetical protein